MNNFFPLLVMLMLSQGNNGGTFNMQSLSPILKMLGVDENILSNFLGGEFSSLLKGEFSIEKLLPMALSMMSGNMQKPFSRSPSDSDADDKPYDHHTEKQKENGDAQCDATPNYLKPIYNIADDEVNRALACYFANS